MAVIETKILNLVFPKENLMEVLDILDHSEFYHPIPSSQLAHELKDVHTLTPTRDYEDLQRDGFIETTVGRGSFVSTQNKEFYQEEQQRIAEEHLQAAAEIGRTSNISLEKLTELLAMFYREDE